MASGLLLSRGKRAWAIIADAYAGFLLLLSLTGLWMFPGRKGLFGRAGLIFIAEALLRYLYVTLFGGPQATRLSPDALSCVWSFY